MLIVHLPPFGYANVTDCADSVYIGLSGVVTLELRLL